MRRRVLFVLAVAAFAASCAGSKPAESADGPATSRPASAAADGTDDERTDDVVSATEATHLSDRPADEAGSVSAPDDAIDALAEVEQAFAELDAELAGLAETLDDIDSLTALSALDR